MSDMKTNLQNHMEAHGVEPDEAAARATVLAALRDTIVDFFGDLRKGLMPGAELALVIWHPDHEDSTICVSSTSVPAVVEALQGQLDSTVHEDGAIVTS
jgi:hypothetical protein